MVALLCRSLLPFVQRRPHCSTSASPFFNYPITGHPPSTSGSLTLPLDPYVLTIQAGSTVTLLATSSVCVPAPTILRLSVSSIPWTTTASRVLSIVPVSRVSASNVGLEANSDLEDLVTETVGLTPESFPTDQPTRSGL